MKEHEINGLNGQTPVGASKSQHSYTEARFFKCALQVNPVDYIEHRGEQQALSEEEYNQALLTAALEAKVQVIGLAPHGKVDKVEAIRSLFTQNGIVVFPGFEIASSEKVHFVCLMKQPPSSKLVCIWGRWR